MVLQKRLEYGFNGYQVPATPRAARSTRRRSAFKKKGEEENQVSAFDLLAAVAGKLLLEGGNSSTSSNNTSANGDQCVVSQTAVKKEPHNEDQIVKVETCDKEHVQRGFFVSEVVPESHQTECFEESPSCLDHAHFGFTSVIATSDFSDRFDTWEMVNGKTKNGIKISTSDCYKPDCDDKLHVQRSNNDGKVSGDVVVKNEHYCLCSGDNKPVCEDPIPQSSFPITQDDVNLVSRDDDENSSACTHINNEKKPFRSTPRLGDRRLRKILASRYWKVSSKSKEVPITNTDADLKPGYCSRNNYYKRLRSERNYPIKKRRYFNYLSVSNTDRGISSEGISGSQQKCIIGDDSQVRKGGQQTPFHSRESHVKLRIKSFRVPELFIEIPETATVGSLKRTVLEAVTAILGGGLCIGVLVEGKKIRDDNKTLLQTGISQDIQTDNLGFCLEPNPSQSLQPLCPQDSNFLLPCNVVPHPLTRYLPEPGNCDGLVSPSNLIENDYDSADKSTMEYSRAVVNVQPLHAKAITVIPPRKSKRSEVAKRRIRRPFSVAEVEALVQAVEKLGTGRWRDVKLRAFDNAKHRTYVDLKDKWKTLVHTARIAPQQRRGEPVPQELLDRVLTAHAYWYQQQGKQPQQQLETTLVL